MEARNEEEILKYIAKYRKKIKKLGKHTGNIDSWNDESYLSDMAHSINCLNNGIERARMYYKYIKKK
jgi:hypothetical protein